MSGHQHARQSHGARPASDYRLDQFAAAVAEGRNNPAVAGLVDQEDAFIDAAMDIGAHLDRQTLGAAWLILGQLMGTRLQSTPPEQQPMVLGMLLQVARLAGQKLYTGTGLPVTVSCPFTYSGGGVCSTKRTAPTQDRLDLLMRAHVAQNHPGKEWPPQSEDTPFIIPGSELAEALADPVRLLASPAVRHGHQLAPGPTTIQAITRDAEPMPFAAMLRGTCVCGGAHQWPPTQDAADVARWLDDHADCKAPTGAGEAQG